MSTWLGWLAPWGAPLTLLDESAEQVAAAQRELARIGIDRPAAAATGAPEDWAGGDRAALRELAAATFAADLAAARAGHPPCGLLAPDVRMPGEWRAGHIDGAVHIPLPERPARLDEVPGGTVWVHCSSGYRAAAASSLLTLGPRTPGPPGRRIHRADLRRASVAVPRAKWIAGVIGAGLAFAAVSDTCAMGAALARLPHNRGPRTDIGTVLRALLRRGRLRRRRDPAQPHHAGRIAESSRKRPRRPR